MNFKDELKRELRNVKNDVAKKVDKTWKLDYKGHRIEIKNQLLEELLLIDGVVVDRHTRKSIWGHIIPFVKLKGVLQTADGKKHRVFVKLGGYIKFHCIVKVDKEIIYTDQMKLDLIPWENKEKIVLFIEQQIKEHGKIVKYPLPDEDYFYGDDEQRLEPGLWDQLVDDVPTPFYVKKLLKLFTKQMAEPTTKKRKATYEQILLDNIASYGNELIDRLEEANLDEQLVQQEALWLLEHATHREVVKFAIVVLGKTNCEKYYDKLYTLGLHDEFTAFVIFALKNGPVQVNNTIWQLAQNVQGWGKVVALNGLDAGTQAIKHWLLTNGCDGSDMDKYIAHTCAVKGELDVALYENRISKVLYDGAGKIIEGLFDEVAVQDADDYAYTSSVFNRFVHHAKEHCVTLDDFYPVVLIGEYVKADEDKWISRFEEQWTYRERADLEKALQSFTENPKWASLAIESIKQDHSEKAIAIASFLELDLTPIIMGQFNENPANSTD